MNGFAVVEANDSNLTFYSYIWSPLPVSSVNQLSTLGSSWRPDYDYRKKLTKVEIDS